MNKVKTCCFTGHRPQGMPFRFNEKDERCLNLKEKLKEISEKLIKEDKVTHFISGMALGTDIFAAEIIIDLKQKYPNIILEAAIPCESQETKWSEKQKRRYYKILNLCDKKTVLQKNYTHDCMQKRNRYMIDNSDIVIAVWNGTPSGTGNTVEYAQKKEKQIIFIDPIMFLEENYFF